MNLEKTLDLLTHMSNKQRSTVLKWNIKQEETHVHLMFEKQKEHYLKISHKNQDKSTLYQAALCLAAEELYDANKSLNTKNKTRSIEDVIDFTKIQAKQFKRRKRKAEKTEKLLNLKRKLLTLIDEEDFSYEEVSDFLERHHRFKVSGAWIGQIYNRLLKEKK